MLSGKTRGDMQVKTYSIAVQYAKDKGRKPHVFHRLPIGKRLNAYTQTIRCL